MDNKKVNVTRRRHIQGKTISYRVSKILLRVLWAGKAKTHLFCINTRIMTPILVTIFHYPILHKTPRSICRRVQAPCSITYTSHR